MELELLVANFASLRMKPSRGEWIQGEQVQISDYAVETLDLVIPDAFSGL